MPKEEIYICTDRWCHELGARRILERVKAYVEQRGNAQVSSCRCLGYCEQGVNAMKNGRIYHDLTEEDAIETLATGEGRARGSVQDIDLDDDFLGDI